MNRYNLHLISIVLFAIATLSLYACEESISVQDTHPNMDNQLFKAPHASAQTADSIKISETRYIISFKDQAYRKISEQAAQQAVERTQAVFTDYNISKDSLIHQYKYASKGFAASLTKEQAEALRQDERIEHIVNDFSYKATQEISTTTRTTEKNVSSVPWGVARVGGPLDGTGKRAWVIDTGIQLDHPDLNVDLGNSASFVAEETSTDNYGHGTSVAGVIAASDNSNSVGVAADAYVVSVKVCNSSGECYVSDAKAGVDYAAANYSSGEIANISLAWPIEGNPRVDISLSLLEDAIETAADDGLRFTLAAGNDSTDTNNHSPARIVNNNVWTTSAMDQSDIFASFSNYGNPPINYANPGVDIFTTDVNSGTTTADGTSFAAPHLAGLLLAAPNDIRTDGYVSNDPDGNPDAIAAFIPFSVTITGSNPLSPGELGTWTANVENPDGTVSYQWYYTDSSTSSWIPDGTNSSTYSRSFSQPSQSATENGVRVVVTDNSGQVEDIQYVSVLQEDCTDPTLPCPN